MGGVVSGQRGKGAPGQVKEVTSLANPIVKDIRALAVKKYRDQTGTFMAEGLKLVIEALDLGWEIRTLVISKSQKANAAVGKVAARTVASGGLVLEVSEKVLTGITRRDNPQMAVGVFSQRWTKREAIRVDVAGREELVAHCEGHRGVVGPRPRSPRRAPRPLRRRSRPGRRSSRSI